MDTMKMILIAVVGLIAVGCSTSDRFSMADRLTVGYTDTAMNVALDATRDAAEIQVEAAEVAAGIATGDIQVETQEE